MEGGLLENLLQNELSQRSEDLRSSHDRRHMSYLSVGTPHLLVLWDVAVNNGVKLSDLILKLDRSHSQVFRHLIQILASQEEKQLIEMISSKAIFQIACIDFEIEVEGVDKANEVLRARVSDHSEDVF